MVNGPDIFQRFVGQSEENIRELFAPAERDSQKLGDASPLHVIIFDEIDACMKVRWVTLRARWVTLKARWGSLRARWVTLRARWVTLRARWVTLRARWVTLRAHWVTLRAR